MSSIDSTIAASSTRPRVAGRPRIALTTGEPAGIGPEISMAALRDNATLAAIDLTLIGDEGLLAERARRSALDLPAHVRLRSIPLVVPAVAGRLDRRNVPYVLATLNSAIDGCLDGTYDAIVTAPIQKSTIIEAGVPFSGHTEYLAERSATPQVVMMLVGNTPLGPLRVALATTHLSLSQVPNALNQSKLIHVLEVLARDLRERFGIAAPRIAVTGLNPHAGESGHLGREEVDIIAPAIAHCRANGMEISGPLPADTVFVPAVAQRYDAVLAMYHDQGLPVLKYATFGHGVNVTLGLPFVRTSVDHGTALDLAGKGTADAGSLCAALALAGTLAKQRV
jgi:4-hydroxythreonine-4-phosphate dehydrogenase